MSDFQSPDWSPTDSEQAKASDYKTNAGGYDHNDLGTVRALLKHTMVERDQHWKRIAELEAELADWRDAAQNASGERCDPTEDEVHCACVGPLRAEITRLETKVRATESVAETNLRERQKAVAKNARLRAVADAARIAVRSYDRAAHGPNSAMFWKHIRDLREALATLDKEASSDV